MKPLPSRIWISILCFAFNKIGSKSLSSKLLKDTCFHVAFPGYFFFIDVFGIFWSGKLIEIVSSWKQRESWITVCWLVFTFAMTIDTTK